MKPYLILTCCDQKYGDFFIKHWLRSLKKNVNLRQIDIAVIDYGLSAEQTKELQEHQVVVIQGSKGGHVVTLRFKDAGEFLANNNYQQILFIDGGDIIFQADFSSIFDHDQASFRIVPLDMEVMFFEAFIPHFPIQFRKELWWVLKNRPVLNAGVIFAPKDKFIALCKQVNKFVSNKNTYGPDQIIVNYVLYQSKIKLINKKYNFIFGTEREGFRIRNSVFYRKNGEKIIIAHNAGHDSFLRPIGNFGYGKGHNQLKYPIYIGRRIIFMIFRGIRILQQLLKL